MSAQSSSRPDRLSEPGIGILLNISLRRFMFSRRVLGADASGAFPLIGGALLSIDDQIISSGSAASSTAPDWLRGRASGTYVVLGERAYAFTGSTCDVQIYDAKG